jgi:polysaccharide deacetylase family protein (PEP-CTERM system associated)
VSLQLHPSIKDSRQCGRSRIDFSPINQSPEVQRAHLNALSVDVEDYFHVESFASHISRSDWPQFKSRVHENTRKVLELLAEAKSRATFFILGWVAEQEPSLIREIADQGHELGCHSYLHRPVYQMTPDQFREDTRKCRNIVEDLSGVKVQGYRAPTFSITARSLWALDILAEEGFQYDSSIFPIRHDRYGIPEAPPEIHRRDLSSGRSIWEIPPSTVRFGAVNVPFGGGGYLRLLPMSFTRWAIRRTRTMCRPIVVYFHPWELDPDQPRLRAKWLSRVRHYYGLGKTQDRLREILRSGNFRPLIDLVSATPTAGRERAFVAS